MHRRPAQPVHFLAAFLVVVFLYFGIFYGLEYLQTYRGPWQITFANTDGGHPLMVIRQPHLGIHAVRIKFIDAPPTALSKPRTVRFSHPREPVPFGKVIFDDLMFLPGTVVLECFGHQIELVPRLLKVDQREYEWRSPLSISLEAKPAPTRKAPAKGH